MGRDIYLGPDSTKWDTFYVLSVLFWVVGIVAGWFAFSNQFGVNLVQYANTYGWSAWLKFEPLYGLIYFSFWVSIACVGVVVLGLVLRKVDSWSGLNVLPGWWERFCIQLDKIKAVTKRVREKRPPVVVEPLVAVSAVRPMAS
ncbi:hypothetical protein BDR26DRAFT_852690 [Obelidium mucronatum]|nr:hypothetical protein BDR26DRAFT_852690 [Obelidium mucronatum]